MDLEHILPSCSPWRIFDHAEVHRKLKKVTALLGHTKIGFPSRTKKLPFPLLNGFYIFKR